MLDHVQDIVDKIHGYKDKDKYIERLIYEYNQIEKELGIARRNIPNTQDLLKLIKEKDKRIEHHENQVKYLINFIVESGLEMFDIENPNANPDERKEINKQIEDILIGQIENLDT